MNALPKTETLAPRALSLGNADAKQTEPAASVPRIAFAANRQIGVEALSLLVSRELRPVALLVPEPSDGSIDQMIRMLPGVPLLRGKEFREPPGKLTLKSLGIDYILSVHFPYVIPQEVLDIPTRGTLNLHPGWLPYNRGWHTPSWAILEETPYGATLHWVDAGVDTGDLALRRQVSIRPADTADSLYARVLAEEIELLAESIPLLIQNRLPRIPQQQGGTQHKKSELTRVRRLDLDETTSVREVLRRIRALTTNRDDEAAWFEADGSRFIVQIQIRPDEENGSQAITRRAA